MLIDREALKMGDQKLLAEMIAKLHLRHDASI